MVAKVVVVGVIPSNKPGQSLSTDRVCQGERTLERARLACLFFKLHVASF